MTLAILRGGAHDGKTTEVADGVTRLVTVSDAPGLLDVYELLGDETHVAADTDDPEFIFEFTAQEPATGFAPEMLHMPGSAFSDGDGDGSAGDVVVDPADLRAAEVAAHDAGADVDQP
ncbi:MAG: hypothetical protein JWM93_1512 [Frankiales bacterium]|nr:hypothetical protein [Frankiales bacterium]